MADFHLVDVRGWDCDLQSVYTAYMGYFQLDSIPWFERSWGHLFNSFEDFLAFSWPVITVTDTWTGRAHIVTRMTSVGAFVKMIKTRFGETLPLVDNILKIDPFENHQRHLRTVSDWASYKKLHATLPAVFLAALKTRIRSGEPRAIQELWEAKDKTFLAIDLETSERNPSSILEWGYAAVRCGHLHTLGTWPPVPEDNYRKGHYIVSEYSGKVVNKHSPTFPWQYAFGDSQVIPKAKLPEIIQATISSLASPDSETLANSLVLVSHAVSEDLRRFEEMRIKLPHNVLIIDVPTFEACLFKAGLRGAMLDAKSGTPRLPNTMLSLRSLLHSLSLNIDYALHNAGNDAFACLLALQLLLDPKSTTLPLPRVRNSTNPYTPSISRSPAPLFVSPVLTPPLMSASRPWSHSASPQAAAAQDHIGLGENMPGRRSPHTSSKFLAPDRTMRRLSALPTEEHGRITYKRSASASALEGLTGGLARATIG
ncbi:hypothetical protein FA95DRAFT_1513754 [Auriscalpium vulgare]|uniref:Uncharacterized protein n=1 Tax=Auriscalpium vulgare TaxID=40419 RepID=A0ACB8S351_9AGAM|nr:hypothetical protein FA95DRAFT_1513754 [Auriscalpium vulgare]